MKIVNVILIMLITVVTYEASSLSPFYFQKWVYIFLCLLSQFAFCFFVVRVFLTNPARRRCRMMSCYEYPVRTKQKKNLQGKGRRKVNNHNK